MLAQAKLRRIDPSHFVETILPREPLKLEGFFPGVVVGGISKKYPGFVKVKIYGVTDDLPNADQPWAEPAPQISFRVPRDGTSVLVYFKNGDIHFPVYTHQSTEADYKYIPKEGIKEDYPDTQVIYSTQTGTKILHNSSNNTTSINHESGVSIIITPLGAVEIKNAMRGPSVNTLTALDICPFTHAPHGGGTSSFKVPMK